MVKNLPANAGDTSSIPGSRRCPEEGNRLPHSSVSKESACNAGDLGLIPQLGRPPGEGNGNPLQYSCLENPMDRGAWRATVHGVARVGHNLVTKLPPPPLQYSCLENPMDRGAW